MGILREFGYQARATARSKDGGVDAIVDHPDFGNIYAQVKHSKNKVGVRIFRELIGTMCITGTSTALLVTSSSFTRGVLQERSLVAQRGFVVELVDGERLLAALNLSHRLNPPTLTEVLAVARPTTEIFRSEVSV